MKRDTAVCAIVLRASALAVAAHFALNAQCLQAPKARDSGVRLTIASEKQTYTVGDRVGLRLQLSNQSSNTYTRIETFYEREFEITVKNAAGHEATLSDFGRRIRQQPYMDTFANDFPFRPGDTFSAEEDAAKVDFESGWGSRYGDLVPIATSFDEIGRSGLQTPFCDTVSHLWKGSILLVSSQLALGM